MTQIYGYFAYTVTNGILSRTKFVETGYHPAEAKHFHEEIVRAKFPLTEDLFATLSLNDLEKLYPIPESLRWCDRLPVGPLTVNAESLRKHSLPE